jgi:hypothetical protein
MILERTEKISRKENVVRPCSLLAMPIPKFKNKNS